ncbi:hypothetical protein KKG41_01685 [Patescibacteria group bacterium]|nr:hypothetical protein [Patescibacteria group bacterium]MBU1890488.1 hypothetical protein [Patescibacteria group bacterium]
MDYQQTPDTNEGTMPFEDVVSDARIELAKPDPDEKPYPGAKAMRALIQAQSFKDSSRIPDLMAQNTRLQDEYEKTTEQEARATLIERINQDLGKLLDEIETPAEEAA